MGLYVLEVDTVLTKAPTLLFGGDLYGLQRFFDRDAIIFQHHPCLVDSTDLRLDVRRHARGRS